MSDPNSAGSMPPPPGGGQKSNATLILVLSILGIVCCSPCAPVAWYMANKQLASGTTPASDEGMLKAAKIIGIIGTVILVFSLIWIVGFGGMAVLSGLAGAGAN